MADLLSKLRMLDAAPKRPAPAAREAQEGCYRSQATFPLSIFTDLRHLTPAVMESAFGFPFPSDLRPEDILFLDTETTGLAGGAGTVAFLVGMGYFTGRDFAVEQVLMRDYGQESELLRTVSAVAGRFSVLCTFNGRTFDAPLLASRFVMNRLPSRLPSAHADVLYPARRLWKLRLKRCNLANLEEQLLHVKREDDLPGAEVPQTYFRYLRDGDFWCSHEGSTAIWLDQYRYVCHLAGIESFGVSYLTPFAANAGEQVEGHAVLRRPLKRTKLRPAALRTRNRRNQR